ncbi:virion protein [Vibrio lentus]|nr:virion protein [Vibrio lentus]
MTYEKLCRVVCVTTTPLNIRESKVIALSGIVGICSTSIKKPKSSSILFGFRAGARVLRSYSRQGFQTLSEMINRFAPSVKRHWVIHQTRQRVDGYRGNNQVVDVNNNEQLAKLLHAMSRKEVGSYYGLSMAREGVAMA